MTDKGAGLPDVWLVWGDVGSVGPDVAFTVEYSAHEHANIMAADYPELGPWRVRKYVDAAGLARAEGIPMKPTQAMIDRFLSWKLPDDFGPDCYISFDRDRARKNNGWPVGTNLLTAEQATAMLKYVLDAAPAAQVAVAPPAPAGLAHRGTFGDGVPITEPGGPSAPAPDVAEIVAWLTKLRTWPVVADEEMRDAFRRAAVLRQYKTKAMKLGSSAITFWGKRDLREVLRIALRRLDDHYASKP